MVCGFGSGSMLETFPVGAASAERFYEQLAVSGQTHGRGPWRGEDFGHWLGDDIYCQGRYLPHRPGNRAPRCRPPRWRYDLLVHDRFPALLDQDPADGAR